MLLLASQILVAEAQYVSPELNDPSDWGSLGYSVLPYFLPTCPKSEDNRCVNDVEPEVTEKPIKVKYIYPTICGSVGGCGEVNYNEEDSKN